MADVIDFTTKKNWAVKTPIEDRLLAETLAEKKVVKNGLMEGTLLRYHFMLQNPHEELEKLVASYLITALAEKKPYIEMPLPLAKYYLAIAPEKRDELRKLILIACFE